MIERLQHLLTRIEQLPPEIQEEVVAQLEVLTESLGEFPNEKTNTTQRRGTSLAGAWSDVVGDDEVEAFDHLRHASQPTPPY